MSRSIWELDWKDAVSGGLDRLQSNALRTFSRIEAMESRFEANMRNAGAASVNAANQSTGAFGMMGAVLGGNLLTQVVNYGKQGVMAMVGLGASQELVSTGYATILKDAKLTEDTLRNLKGFADWSPFNTGEVMQFGQDMLIAGVKAQSLIPTMSRLGDISGGNAQKMKGLAFVYSQVMTQGKARTQDLYQMMNAGMPILTELQKLTGLKGEALNKFIEEGKVTSQVVDQAINSMTSQGGMFYQALMKGSDTTTGKWNAFMSGLENLAVKAFQKMQPFINDMINFGSEILPYLQKGLKIVWDTAVGFGGWVKEHSDLIKGLGIAVGGLLVAYTAYKVEMLAYKGIMGALKVFEMGHLFMLGMQEGLTIKATLAQMGLNTAFLMSPFGWMVGGIAAVAAGFAWAWNSSEKFRKGIFGLWEVFKQVFTNIGGFFKQIFDPIAKGIDAFHRRDWAGMGKAVLQMGVNLTPVGLAANAAMYAKDGGFNKGIGSAWANGKKKGSESFKNKDGKVSSATSYNEVAQLNNSASDPSGDTEAGKGKGKGKGAGAGEGGGGTSHRNVTVTINGGLVKELNIHAANVEESMQRIKEKVAEVLIGAVRDSELALADHGV